MNDTIEIRDGNSVLRGKGRLDLSTATTRVKTGVNQDGSPYRIIEPIVPSVSGYIIFDDNVRETELMKLTNATVRCTDAGGALATFTRAFFVEAHAGKDRNGYSIKIEAMSVS